MSFRTETLPEIVNVAVSRAMRNLFTWMPAKVVKWDASSGRVDCQILIKDVYEDEEGNRQTESFAVIPSVPVQFMGAGGCRLTLPVGDGSGGTEQTIGTLFFGARSLDKWLSGKGQEVDPEFDHHHAKMDAVFLPGLMPFGAPWQDVPTDGWSLGKDSGLQIKGTTDLITLAETLANAQFVALANLVDARLSTIKTAYNTHKHSETGTTTGVPDTPIGTLATVAADKVKAE